jgi:hypothetical protein
VSSRRLDVWDDPAKCSSDKIEGNTRNQVEQENADLVKRDPGDIDHIELFGGQVKQSADRPDQPIVRQ